MNISLMVQQKWPKVKLKTLPRDMTTSFCLNYVKPSNISKHWGYFQKSSGESFHHSTMPGGISKQRLHSAFFLIQSHRENLEKVCNFISNEWAEAWFSNQHYKKSIYQDLLRGITQLSCPKILKCFQTHWVDIPSAVEVARSNMVAKRGIKIMEEIQKNSKHNKYLGLKFLISNLNM